MTLSREQKKAVVRNFLIALRNADIPTLKSILVENAAWQIPKSSPPPFAGRHQGRDKILSILETSLPNMFVPGIGGVDVGEILVDNDKVVAEAVISGETPKGKYYENQYVFVITLRGNQLVEFKEHLDTKHAHDIFWSD